MPSDRYVSGVELRRGDHTMIARFSSHWAAVAAMIRLHDPEFKSMGGDREADLETERSMTP